MVDGHLQVFQPLRSVVAEQVVAGAKLQKLAAYIHISERGGQYAASMKRGTLFPVTSAERYHIPVLHGQIEFDLLFCVHVNNHRIFNRAQRLKFGTEAAAHIAAVEHIDNQAGLAVAKLKARFRDFQRELEAANPSRNIVTAFCFLPPKWVETFEGYGKASVDLLRWLGYGGRIARPAADDPDKGAETVGQGGSELGIEDAGQVAPRLPHLLWIALPDLPGDVDVPAFDSGANKGISVLAHGTDGKNSVAHIRKAADGLRVVERSVSKHHAFAQLVGVGE